MDCHFSCKTLYPVLGCLLSFISYVTTWQWPYSGVNEMCYNISHIHTHHASVNVILGLHLRGCSQARELLSIGSELKLIQEFLFCSALSLSLKLLLVLNWWVFPPLVPGYWRRHGSSYKKSCWQPIASSWRRRKSGRSTKLWSDACRNVCSSSSRYGPRKEFLIVIFCWYSLRCLLSRVQKREKFLLLSLLWGPACI